ncbi:hypothetical protein HY251_04150, partial [bacterium]|nr:hypothetical protein [bacterium]
MEDLWGRYGFRGLAFLLLAVFALLRILQVFFQHKQLKREGLRGNYIAQAVVGLACAAGALVLCEPSIFGLSGTEEKPREPPAPVTTVQRTVPLPPNVRFVGPLAPAKEAIVREDWAALAKIIFDLRRAHGSTNDTNFLLQWKAKPLGKVYLERGREALKAGDMDLARQYLDYAVELLTEDVDPPLLRSETYPPAEWRSTLRDLKQAA